MKTELLESPVFSPFRFGMAPAETQVINREKAAPPLEHRDSYLPLPLTIERLPETTWVNIHTAGFTTVQTINFDRAGHPGPDVLNSGFSIGLWWSVASEPRFMVENWVQLDPADIALCYQWKLYGLDRRVKQYRSFLSCKGSKTSGMNYDYALKHYQEALEEIITYAGQQGLTKAEIYRLQAQAQGKPVQMGIEF